MANIILISRKLCINFHISTYQQNINKAIYASAMLHLLVSLIC